MRFKTDSRLWMCQVPAERNIENKICLKRYHPLGASAWDTILWSNISLHTRLICWRNRSGGLKSLLLIDIHSFGLKLLNKTHPSLLQGFSGQIFLMFYIALVARHHLRSVRSKSSFLLCLRCSYCCLPSSREVWEHSALLLQKVFY